MTEPAESPSPGKFDRHKTINRVLDQLDEITEPRNISEQYDAEGRVLAKRHVHTLPSLLEALRAAVVPGGDVGQQTGAREFESRPAARIPPIDVIRGLDKFARKWCVQQDVRRATTLGHLMALKGFLSSLDERDINRVSRDLDVLYSAARVATGYDDPPSQIGGEKCPWCGKESLMWNRQEDDFRAWCTDKDCKAEGVESNTPRSWDNGTLGLFRQMLEHNRTKETMTDDQAVR